MPSQALVQGTKNNFSIAVLFSSNIYAEQHVFRENEAETKTNVQNYILYMALWKQARK